jgi:hypothetical protein
MVAAMLHPVGNLAPSIYWRRRVLLLAAVLLAAVSVYAVLRGGGGGSPGADASAPPKTSVSNTPATHSSASSPSPSQSRSSAGAPKACTTAQLTVAAATDATSYKVGGKPRVAMVVTNNGPAPCVADLADKQIELRVYAGSARVWGSHDCAIAPGTSPATLPVGQHIKRDIEWSGLSSQPGCAGVRQRVPAGTYTLFALLNGHQGSTATFAFTS